MWLRNGNQAEKAFVSVYMRRNKRKILNADYCKILNQLDVQLMSWCNVNKIIIILIIALIYQGLLTMVSYTAPQALQAQLISSLSFKLFKCLNFLKLFINLKIEIEIMTEVTEQGSSHINFKFGFIVETLNHHIHHWTRNKDLSTRGYKSAMWFSEGLVK